MTTATLYPTEDSQVMRDTNRLLYTERACAYAPCGKLAWMLKRSRFCSNSCAALSRSRDNPHPCGEDHPNWIGDDVGYGGMHDRVRQVRGSANSCVNGCTHSRYEWAHIHDTDPLIADNYQEMCKRCHAQYDTAKLTWERVDEIRALNYFGVPQARLAEMYDTRQGNISVIVNGKTWIPAPICTEIGISI